MKRSTLIAVLSFIGFFAQQVQAQNSDQSRPSNTERQLIYLEKVEQSIYYLSYDTDHMQNEIIPTILQERQILAPNYPDRSDLNRNESEIKAAYLSWIEQHSTEYTAYLKYLLQFTQDHN